jgi:hypothetical protein
MQQADQYRKKAEDCVKLAERSTDSLLKDTWLWLAAAWRRLAQRTETANTEKQ